MIRALALSIFTAAILAACATATPYGPAEADGGYGFSEQRIEKNRYRLTFRGNSSTTRETVENYLLFRSAELTVQKGYDYYIVIEGDTETKKSYSSSGYGSFYGSYGYGHGRGHGGHGFHSFPYYAYGFGGGYPYDSYTREITRYSAIAFITMHKGEKPADQSQAFNAREVVENLRPLILSGQEAGSNY